MLSFQQFLSFSIIDSINACLKVYQSFHRQRFPSNLEGFSDFVDWFVKSLRRLIWYPLHYWLDMKSHYEEHKTTCLKLPGSLHQLDEKMQTKRGFKTFILNKYNIICAYFKKTNTCLCIHFWLACPMRNNFPKRPLGAPLHTLLNFLDVPVGFVPPSPHLRQCIALFAVAEGWLLLDIGWFVLFF